MSKIEEQSSGKKEGQIRYLTPLNIDTNIKKKYCRFKRSGIKYVDYKDPNFLIKFVNEQGKILTETSYRYVAKVSKKGISRCQKSPTSRFDAICRGFIKINNKVNGINFETKR